MAEAEGLAFVHFDGVEAVVQDGLCELSGAPETELVKRKDDDEVEAGFREESELMRERRDEREALGGEEDVGGMGVEGDGNRPNAKRASTIKHGGEDHAMAAVYAVEVADGDNRGGAGESIEIVEDLHQAISNS